MPNPEVVSSSPENYFEARPLTILLIEESFEMSQGNSSIQGIIGFALNLILRTRGIKYLLPSEDLNLDGADLRVRGSNDLKAVLRYYRSMVSNQKHTQKRYNIANWIGPLGIKFFLSGLAIKDSLTSKFLEEDTSFLSNNFDFQKFIALENLEEQVRYICEHIVLELIYQEIDLINRQARSVGGKYNRDDFTRFKNDPFRSHLQFHALSGHPILTSVDEYNVLYKYLGEYLRDLHSGKTINLDSSEKLSVLIDIWERNHPGQGFFEYN